MSIGVLSCIAMEYIHTCVSNTKQKQNMYIFTLCMSLLWESSSSHRAGFTRLKITTSWSFLPITCSENHIRRFWLSWPNLPNESSITTSSQHWYTQSLHNENRHRYSGTLSKSSYIVPATRDCGNHSAEVSSYFSSGENKSNCLDHISPIESESEADHISPLVKVNVIVWAIFYQ